MVCALVFVLNSIRDFLLLVRMPRHQNTSNHLFGKLHSNNGHMIKFELFDSENSYQCHFAQIGTFVVSIAHYMRAYFNYEALVNGQNFELPGDAGFLNVRDIFFSLSEPVEGFHSILASLLTDWHVCIISF